MIRGLVVAGPQKKIAWIKHLAQIHANVKYPCRTIPLLAFNGLFDVILFWKYLLSRT